MSLPGLRGATGLLQSKWLILLVSLVTVCGTTSQLSAQVINADGTGANGGGVAPASYTSSGSYFNRELGTPLRASFFSEGYGVEESVVSLGTMKVFNMDGAVWFLDGQGTMSESFGGGFNFGAGYRELVSMSHGYDPERILGGSFWTDGQSTAADNFFTQLGFGLESLGESYDLRLNGYFPLDRTQASDPTLINTNVITFAEDGLFAGTQRITTDTAYSVIDAEAAKRIHNLDAWALAGVYHLGGGGADDTGYRVGVRGYAVPDLLVGVQVSEDNIYDTEVMATLTWFVGRTHSGNAPIGAIVDRFREPVMRNNFIATTSASEESGAVELTDADTNEFFDFIHVNSAGPNGNGTFENPFNNLADAEDAQQEGSYVYMHGGSVLAGTESFTFLDNVKFWGEGTNQFGDVVLHVVDTVERGTVTLPETRPAMGMTPGSRDLAAPEIIIAPAVVDFAILGDNNNFNNIEFNGGQNVIVADSANANVNAAEAAEELANAAANGINAPQMANLDINGPTGTAINFTQITGTAVIDNTVTIDDAGTGIFIDRGLGGMNINAQITNSIGSSLVIEDRTGGTIAFGGSIQDDNAVASTADSIIIRNNQDAVINFTQVIDAAEDQGIDINSGNFTALSITGNDIGTIITFADLRATAADADTIEMTEGGVLTINDSDDESLIANTGTGDAFRNVGGVGADQASTIVINPNITNEGGGNAVDISAREQNNVTFNGTITDTGATTEAILLTGNSGGTIAFNEQVTIDSVGAGFGVRASGGSDTIAYNFTDIDITTEDGTGFSMLDGGTLTVAPTTGEENSIATTTGQALVLDRDGSADPLAIGTAGVTFDTIDVDAGTTDSVVLRDIEGGQVQLGGGDNPGDGGTINTTATGMIIDNAANVAVDNININKTGGGVGEAVSIINQEEVNATTDSTIDFNGVVISGTGASRGLVIGSTTVPADGNEDGTTATFTDLVVTTADGNGVTVQNNTGGTYIFNDLTSTTSGTGDAVHIQSNTADTIVTFNGMDLDATGVGGDAFSSEDAVELAATGDTSVSANTGRALFIEDATIGTAGAQFDTVTVTNATTNGVVVRDTTGTGLVTIGSSAGADPVSTITSNGTGIVIDNADNNVAINRVTIDNDGTAGNGLVIENQDTGTVSTTSLITRTDSGTGVVIRNNTGGSNVFTTTNVTADNAGNNSTGGGVSLTNNTGSISSFSGLVINTQGGTGFAAEGGGTISATGTNTVTTTTGVGVDLDGMTIGAAGFNLNSVNVNGAVNGVVLTNTTGGQFRQGAATAIGTDGAGGTLSTTGNSIVINGATNAVFNDVTASSSGGRGALVTHTASTQTNITFDNFTNNGAAGSLTGLEVVDNGSGELDFTLRNSEINTIAGGDDVAFLFTAGNSTGDVDLRIQTNTLLADNASALSAVINQGSGNVQYLMTNNTITNNSAAAGAAQFNVGGRVLNATVGGQGTNTNGNLFTNNNATGVGFVATTAGVSRINLDLRDNTSVAGNANKYQLTNAVTADFGIVDRDDTLNDLNNTGNVNGTGTFDDIPSVLQVD